MKTAQPPPSQTNMSTNSVVDNVQANFSHSVLPQIMGKPNYESLYHIHKLTTENALFVSTELGGGNHGHLALIIPPAVNQTTAGTAFPPPHHPGPVPVSTRQFMTNAEIDLLKETHWVQVQQFEWYHNTDKALKQQLPKAVDENYTKALKQNMI
eukprot:218544-Ditylum_brightwellii.AAC.1